MNALRGFIPALAIATLVTANTARATEIVAGPMIGHITESSVRVWVQVNTSERVTVRAIDVVTGRSPGGVTLDVEGPAPYVADLPLSQLDANRSYRIEMEFDGKPVDVGAPIIIRTAPPAGETTGFTVALAGGVDMGADGKRAVPSAGAIAALKPQTALMLGNLGVLPPTEDAFPKTRREAYTLVANQLHAVRTHRDMREIFRTVPTTAIWGERDFGPENAAKNFIYARESMLAFRRFWPNPMYGTPEARGVFFSSTYADVDFFAVDARMQRDPESDKDRKHMLGEKQLEWLKDGLSKSRASLKIVASSSPILSDEDGAWGKYKDERDAFVSWVLTRQVKGVVFVSQGPYGQILCKKPKDNAGYPLYELVCPPANIKPAKSKEEPLRLGDPYSANGFGTLVFGGGSKAKRFVTLQIRDEKGEVMIDQTVFAGNLQGQ